MRTSLPFRKERARLGLNGIGAKLRPGFLEHAGNAGNIAAGAERRNEYIQTFREILQNFRAGMKLMRARIARMADLTRNPGSGNFLRKFSCAIDRTLHAELARGEHEFRAVSLRQEAALNAHGFRHDENHAVSENRAHHSETDAGIAGSGLNDGAASL